MSGRKVITTCQFRRPQYTRRMLDALRGCTGIEEYTILVHLEPGHDEVQSLVRGIDFAECRIVENTHQLGVNLNTENALRHGFGLADFVIHLEDDILCAADALRYFEWCGERFASDPRAFSVTGYHRRQSPAPASESHAVRLRPWFHPWGFATWRDRWARFEGTLFDRLDTSWDIIINKTYCCGGPVPQRHEVYPELSRTQNIGLETSRFARSPKRFEHRLSHWAGAHPVPEAEFHEAS